MYTARENEWCQKSGNNIFGFLEETPYSTLFYTVLKM
jgi:hypothetical protein